MSNIWNEIKYRIFKSGNPVMLYIGINAAVFLVTGILSVLEFFSGFNGAVSAFAQQYFAFPADPHMWLTRGYTLITYAFFHQDFFHLLFNLLWLYWMGQLFLDFLKTRQFHFVYWGGAFAGALFFALIYNIAPVFRDVVSGAVLIGASAAVMAVFTAIATLLPDYSIRLMLFGTVKLKYLLLAYILLDIISTSSSGMNVGGSLAHLGGVLWGFIYIKLLQKGNDLSNLLKRKPKLRVVKSDTTNRSTHQHQTKKADQQEIDAILDKISKSGYSNLTAKEKQTLFDASKN
ncbi:rhomboid family intramembrane serine protease [Pedobacter montanisoli]|uniref:Rhomboid family intramembrane serine protease n=1 Tax=Pedobacter montanisoli TaxID=2923277 RepID=A0ABS9ZRX5_9SPHI|nr:rhomboid family intramembrane serine protease [Pedobacter montanisoli]MCJ0741336.1 rhomboid family intramembrane serine protease [Pedobacter montanisoli]